MPVVATLVFLEENSDYYSPLPYIRIVHPLRGDSDHDPNAHWGASWRGKLKPPIFKGWGPGAQVYPFDVPPQRGWGRGPNHKGVKNDGTPRHFAPPGSMPQ